MPRFASWHSAMPPEHSEPDSCLDTVIRPSLRWAFPLPTGEDPAGDRFRRLLEALAQRSGEDERAGGLRSDALT